MNEIAIHAARFATAGAVTTLVGFAVILLLQESGLASPVIANVAGYVVGFLLSFHLHRTWTFRDAAPIGSSLPRYLLVVAVAYGVNLLVLTSLLRLGIGDVAAQILSIAAYSIVNFAASRLFAFRGTTA
jgi:putative flippase GtrA